MSTTENDSVITARERLIEAVKQCFGDEDEARPGIAVRRGNVTAVYEPSHGLYRLDVDVEGVVYRYDVPCDPRRAVRTRIRGLMTGRYADETSPGIYWLAERVDAVAHLPASDVKKAR